MKLASLNNTQETTGSTSTGLGGGILGVDTATGQVRGFAVSSGVDNATASHVHTAARGIAGPITVPLVGGPNHWFVPDNAAALTAADVTAFQAGNMYFNIHNARLQRRGDPRAARRSLTVVRSFRRKKGPRTDSAALRKCWRGGRDLNPRPPA